jgi:uncharacterized RmlC-like cupin family protein
MARTAAGRKSARAAKTAAKRPAKTKRSANVKRSASAKSPANGKRAASVKRAASPKRTTSPKHPTNTKRSASAKRPAKQIAPKSATRRARPAPKPRASTRPSPQRFTVSHHREQDFKTDGLRAYALYRDLGIAAATGGLCQAHVIRLLGPCTNEVRKRHFHETELQLIYVLKGWMRNEFEGHGEQLMQAGSCWLQPPGIEHTVLDYSDDCEVLEIIVPADFKTVALAK